MSANSVNKRKCLSIREKVEIINELERGTKNVDVCKMFSLTSSTVSTLWKNKDVYKSAMENNLTQTKKFRKCERADIDEALIQWFSEQKRAGFPTDGPTLKAQAEKFAVQFGCDDFVCNNGWLDRFKNRHNILYAKVCGESRSTRVNDNVYYSGVHAESDNADSALKKDDKVDDISDDSYKIPTESSSVPTILEAQGAMDTLVNFFEATESTSDDVFNALSVLRGNIRNIQITLLKQSILNILNKKAD